MKNVCWFGDPRQREYNQVWLISVLIWISKVPPFGWSENTKINDIFKVEHLQANSLLLDTSCMYFPPNSRRLLDLIVGNTSDRLPIPIAEFISKEVYDGLLKPHMGHPVKKSTDAVLFVDVSYGVERKEEQGTSFMVWRSFFVICSDSDSKLVFTLMNIE